MVPSIPDRANRLIKFSLMAIKYDLNKLPVAGVKQNMTYDERCALRSLVRNKREWRESFFLQFQKCFAVLQSHQSETAIIFTGPFVKSPLTFSFMDHWCEHVTSSTYLHSNVQHFSIQSHQTFLLSVSSPSLGPESVSRKTMLSAHL